MARVYLNQLSAIPAPHPPPKLNQEIANMEDEPDNPNFDHTEKLEALIDKQVIEELEKIEAMTHEGRGTIAWEMDSLSTYVNERLATLEDTLKDKEVSNE